MLHYFSEQWLNGFRNQTGTAYTILLMELAIIASILISKTPFRQGIQRFKVSIAALVNLEQVMIN